jgi:ribonuclease HII
MGMSKAFLYGVRKIYEYFEPNCVVLDGKPIRGLSGFHGLDGSKTDKTDKKHPYKSALDPCRSAFYFFIKGDQRLCSLGGASILAKTHRDSYMKKMSKKFPEYLFDVHKGYGTKKHYLMIKKYGPCHLHRKTFLKSLISF